MADDELSKSLSAVGDVIDNQITAAVKQQGLELTDKIEAQGRQLTDKIETQGSQLTAKIEAHAQRTKHVETQLGKLETSISSLNRTFDRQQTVIWALVALLGAAVLGVLALVVTIAFSIIEESRGRPSAAQVPAAVEEINSPQPTAGLSNETESAESVTAAP